MRKREVVNYEIWLPDLEYSRILLVTGGRDLVPGPEEYGNLASNLLPGTKLIHGACPYGGADLFAHEFAKGLGFIPILPFWADWDRYGKAAGPRRNREMIRYLVKEQKPCLCLAFRGGTGTANMVRSARASMITVLEV